MLDKDLAQLYGVETRTLNQAVKRNNKRFPADFMFQLTKTEEINLRSQFATSSSRSQFVILNGKRGKNTKYLPLAFTEQGIAMLSSVLNSEKAIAVNIQIIRIFTKLREMIDSYKELREKIEEMERGNKMTFQEIFRIIKLLVTEKKKPKDKIGFSLK